MTSPLPAMALKLGLGDLPLADPPTLTTFDNASGWTGEQFTVTHGRTTTLDQVQAGTASVVLDNSDARFTPGNTGSSLYPNVDTDIRLQLVATPPGGSPFQLFDGHVETWQPDMQGGAEYANVTVNAVDPQQALALQTLRSAFAQNLFDMNAAGGPLLAYYPLSEPSGTTFGDVTGQQSAAVLVRGSGDPAAAFQQGQAALCPSDPAASLDLEATTAGGMLVDTSGGWYVSIRRPGDGPIVTTSGGMTVVVAFQTSSSITMTLWEQWSAAGQTQFRLFLDSGNIWFGVTGDDGTFSTAISTATFNDGLPHLAVADFDADGRTTKVRVDGVIVASYTAGSTLSITPNVGGSAVGASLPNLVTRRFIGLVGHLALFNSSFVESYYTALWQAFSGWPREYAGARVNRLLNAAGWPASRRSIETGNSPLGVSLTAGVDPLTAIQNTAAAEAGLFFIAPNGNATFHARDHRFNTAVAVTLGTATLPVDTSGLKFEQTPAFIRNDVTGTRPQGASVRRVNQYSVDHHFRRTDTLNVELGSDAELLYAVQWRLHRYPRPQTMCGSLTVDPVTAPALWPYIASLGIGDLIATSNLPASAPASTMRWRIEGRTVRADKDTCEVTYTVSPGDGDQYLQLDDPVYGDIDLYPIAW